MKKVLLFLAILASCPAWAQVAVDQVCSNSAATTALTGTCVLPSAAANTLIHCSVGLDDDGTTTISVPTATGLTFVQIGTTQHSAANFYSARYRAYTSSSLGSTTITGHWNVSTDWNMSCVSLAGTAGTAGNNGSDAIGNSNQAIVGSDPTTTVASSAHNNSKYIGTFGFASNATKTITPAGTFSTVTAALYNANFIGMMTVISTSPVSPAAGTTVNATLSGANSTWVDADEILVSTGGGGAAVRHRAWVIQSK